MIDASTTDKGTLYTFYIVDIIDLGTTEVKSLLSNEYLSIIAVNSGRKITKLKLLYALLYTY
jgi:hypothetical protein